MRKVYLPQGSALTLIISEPTRWNSTFFTLETFLALQEALRATVMKYWQTCQYCQGCHKWPISKKDVKKSIRENVSENWFHLKLWPELKKINQSMHFLKSDSQLKGFLITISSLQDIWSYVKQLGFKFLNLRQLNQDSLENLFGFIRHH